MGGMRGVGCNPDHPRSLSFLSKSFGVLLVLP